MRTLKKIVEPDDLRTVRIFGARGPTMLSGNRSLQCEWTRPASKPLFDERQRLGDLLLIPAGAILLFEDNKITSLIETRSAPRIVKQPSGRQEQSLPSAVVAPSRALQGGQAGWPRSTDPPS